MAHAGEITGFIEPHMWAGYSGGRKSILPGISSVKTLKFMHGPEMVADPAATYGKLEGNPFHEAGLQIMERVGADFIVNVTLNTEKAVTGVYSGDPIVAHATGATALDEFTTLEEWIRRALAHELFYNDQWCAQEIFKWMRDHPIHLYSEGITEEQSLLYGMHLVEDVATTIAVLLKKHGEHVRWAVVPDGPLLVLRLKPTALSTVGDL